PCTVHRHCRDDGATASPDVPGPTMMARCSGSSRRRARDSGRDTDPNRRAAAEMARDLDRLMEAYRRTSFQAETPVGHLAIRVGQACPPLDALLALDGAEEWAFITACNPGSVRLSDAENGARMRALHGTIAARGLIAFDGQGVPDCDDWQPEPSLLVLGLPPD